MKSEPDVFGWEQQVAVGTEPWTGVRNHSAKLNLAAMRLGDRAFFYHSNIGKAVVGSTLIMINELQVRQSSMPSVLLGHTQTTAVS